MLNNPQTKFYQNGSAIDYKNTTDKNIKANDVVITGSRICIAAGDIEVGVVGALHTVGVFEIPAVKEEVIGIGTTVYYGENGITATEGDVVAGWVIADKIANSTTSLVKIG